jgi:hypothetical protein
MSSSGLDRRESKCTVSKLGNCDTSELVEEKQLLVISFLITQRAVYITNCAIILFKV